MSADGLVESQPQRYIPLGLAYLASSLIQAGHTPRLLDLNVPARKSLSDTAREFCPDISGVYTNSFNLKQVKEIVQTLRRVQAAPVVLGGPHITWRPETLVWSGADYAIRGDGERALCRLIEHLEGKGGPEAVEGLVRVENGLLVSPPPALVTDLDSLPQPARQLLPRESYHVPVTTGPMTTMVTARGCPFRCIFCALPNHAAYRARDPRLAAQELLSLESEGYVYVDIHDPTFTWKHERIQAFCEELLQADSRITWGCETRADCVSPEILRLMRRAGCVNIRFGVESGVERVRNRIIGKHLSNDDIEQALSESHRAGLETMTFFVLGHPGESLTEMRQSVSFSEKLRATYSDFNLAAPIAGSRLYDRMVKDGEIPPDIWEQVAESRAIPYYVPQGLNLKDINALRAKAYRRHYLSVRSLWHQVRKLSGPRDFMVKARAGLKILRTAHRKDPVIW